MKVQLSLEERTINRIFYESRPKGGLGRDVAVAKILTEAFAEVAAKSEAELSRLRAELAQKDEVLKVAREALDGLRWRRPCTEKCAAMPKCAVCGRTKAPKGRSLPMEAATGYCGNDCTGYYADPQSGHLWPKEWAEHRDNPKRTEAP